MFKFLKDKIKNVVDSVKKKINEDDDIEKLTEEDQGIQQEEIIEDKVEEKIDKEIVEEEISVESEVDEKSKKEDVQKEIEKDIEESKEDEIDEIIEEVVEDKIEDSKKDQDKESIAQDEDIKDEDRDKILEEDKRESKPEEVVEKKEVKKETLREVEEKELKKGFFSKLRDKITKVKITEEKFDEIFWDLEVGLLESNVAMEVIEKIKDDLKRRVVDNELPSSKIEEAIMNSLKESIDEILTFEKFDLVDEIRKGDKPKTILFLGINGTGKTTTIGKFISLLKKNGVSCVVAASDTFRAAAIDQLKEHTDKLGVKLIRHDYGADPAAVAYDAIEYGKSKAIDAVLIDTAGRMHSNSNLMDELKKIVRVAKPDYKIFIGDALTGNDCVEQARTFNEAIGLDGIVISKADADEKGGTALSVAYVTKKPLLYIGTGQRYEDLETFDKGKILKILGF